jgi:hypothetical protein
MSLAQCALVELQPTIRPVIDEMRANPTDHLGANRMIRVFRQARFSSHSVFDSAVYRMQDAKWLLP